MTMMPQQFAQTYKIKMNMTPELLILLQCWSTGLAGVGFAHLTIALTGDERVRRKFLHYVTLPYQLLGFGASRQIHAFVASQTDDMSGVYWNYGMHILNFVLALIVSYVWSSPHGHGSTAPMSSSSVSFTGNLDTDDKNKSS